MSILNWFKSALSIYRAKQKLYRENYFSEEFLMDALLGAGFQSVEILAPTEEGAIDLGAKLFDERGNSSIISVHHLGNKLKFSAKPNRPNNINETQVTKNVNYISVEDTYLPKCIESNVSEGLVFGNETQTSLLRECKRKANSFFDELENEFKRRGKRFAK